jgi:uncharacterized protein DUF4314
VNDLKGKRIELDGMGDKYTTLKPNDRGTVDFVDALGTIHVSWDNGSHLGLIPGEDSFHIIENNKIERR